LAERFLALDCGAMVFFIDLRGAAAFSVAFRRVVFRDVTCFAVFRAG
jgi:hypothetical protein